MSNTIYKNNNSYQLQADVCVIGAGHAGCEAALAAARLGLKTVIFTMNTDSIAMMPCNPHIGGSSKGHLVREIDALGGEMAKNIDKTFIQSKMLNVSKGPAVHSLRTQADKAEYSRQMRHTLENQNNLEIRMGEVVLPLQGGHYLYRNLPERALPCRRDHYGDRTWRYAAIDISERRARDSWNPYKTLQNRYARQN